jgi:RNA polymerase sigma-70 factor (ECF subfamily)
MNKTSGSPTEWLYRLYAGRVYSLSVRLLGDVAAAEEATAAVFIKLARGLGQRPVPANVEDLPLGTTVAVLLRQLDDQRSEAAATGERRAAPRSLEPEGLTSAGLEGAIRRLPVDSRLAFVLHDVEGLSHEKIAGLLGWATGTVKAALAKARLELRELLLKDNRLAPAAMPSKPSKTA